MEITIIEAYDSELGYDEDKYYEINSYKNMVVYAQKNKHKQGLEGITLDFDSLIEDLKKKKILIKSEFENIKESDLEKYGDYYILPDDFVDDIIVQLGYEPSKERIYKNNEVAYKGKVISDMEFEQIIADESNELHWISQCKFKDAQIEIKTYKTRQNTTNILLCFNGGIWKDGVWQEGNFNNSIWKRGTWKYGEFYRSIWKSGIWEDGHFEKSTWKDGTWKLGWLKNKSTWEKGIWEDGHFEKSTWKNGNWEKGNFHNSTWENGVWENGIFIDSNWEKGIWENGRWWISLKSKCINHKTFKPIKITYEFTYNGNPYSFNDIWGSGDLLEELLIILNRGDYINFTLSKPDIIYIGNNLLTKKQIEQRIKEIS